MTKSSRIWYGRGEGGGGGIIVVVSSVFHDDWNSEQDIRKHLFLTSDRISVRSRCDNLFVDDFDVSVHNK